METFTLMRTVDEDGVLRIEVPLGLPLAAVQVVVVVSPETPPPPRMINTAMERAKAKYPRAYQPWTLEEERNLLEYARQGLSARQIAKMLERQPSAVRSRLNRLGFESKDGA